MASDFLPTAADFPSDTPAPLPHSAPEKHEPLRLPLWRWVLEGLRASVFLRPRVANAAPTIWQTTLLYLSLTALSVLLQRFWIDGPAHFQWSGLLSGKWGDLFLLWVGWLLIRKGTAFSSLSAWFFIISCSSGLYLLLNTGMYALTLQFEQVGKLLWDFQAYLTWGFMALAWWAIALSGRVFFASTARVVLGALLVAGMFFGYFSVDSPSTWIEAKSTTENPSKRRFLSLTQEVFEEQMGLSLQKFQALSPERPGVVDVYGLVYAPYAAEDVFLRESDMVRGVLEQRFDAEGRVLELVNNPATAETHVWATTTNLQRAVNAIAAKMNRDEDVVVVYLTSHGGKDFQLAASHWPLKVESLMASELRNMLDAAGIKNRVIAVSACFSGGWIEPLKDAHTLVMTAADADNTSYGCGQRSPLTFFGRAMFDEQLRKTHSFSKAFAAATPVIRERELEVGKEDFSNPQISVGEAIQPVLATLERQLESRPSGTTAR